MRRSPLPVSFCVAALLAVGGCKPPHVKVEETPVKVIHDRPGIGIAAKQGDTVTIDYIVSLPDGEELIKDDEFTFQLGRGAVISGIDDALAGMRPGGERLVNCPPHKHWGRAGYGEKVPPATDLRIFLRMVSVTREGGL